MRFHRYSFLIDVNLIAIVGEVSIPVDGTKLALRAPESQIQNLNISVIYLESFDEKFNTKY